MSPDSRHPHTPQDTPPQLPLPDIHYDTQLTLWDNVDLDAMASPSPAPAASPKCGPPTG